MSPDPERQLWSLRENLRPALPIGEYVNAISQLFVISETARRDSQFKATIENGKPVQDGSTEQILVDVHEALRRLGYDESRQLIISSDSFWTSLNADLILKTVHLLINQDLPGEQYADWLTRRASPFSTGEIGVPDEILFALRELIRDSTSVFLPFDDSARAVLVLTSREQSITVRPHSTHGFRLVSRILFLADRNAQLEHVEPFSNENIPGASTCVLIPPFGRRLDPKVKLRLPGELNQASKLATEESAIASIVVNIKKLTVALVPSGILFRRGSSRYFREWLVENIGLVAVIEFPPRVLGNSSIASAILLIDPTNDRSTSVRLISADSEEFLEEQRAGRFRLSGWKELAKVALGEAKSESSVDVDIDLIRENDYVLNPGRYQSDERDSLQALLKGRETTSLATVVDIRRPIPLKDSHPANGRMYREVLISDFGGDGLIRGGTRERELDESKLERIRQQILKPGDILLGVRGTIGKVAMVAEDADENLLAGQTTVVLRLKDSSSISDPVYLLRYLSQPEVSAFLETLAGGSAISFIRAKDLASLEVPIGTLEEQAHIRKLHDEILETLAESKRLRERAKNLSENAFHAS